MECLGGEKAGPSRVGIGCSQQKDVFGKPMFLSNVQSQSHAVRENRKEPVVFLVSLLVLETSVSCRCRRKNQNIHFGVCGKVCQPLILAIYKGHICQTPECGPSHPRSKKRLLRRQIRILSHFQFSFETIMFSAHVRFCSTLEIKIVMLLEIIYIRIRVLKSSKSRHST